MRAACHVVAALLAAGLGLLPGLAASEAVVARFPVADRGPFNGLIGLPDGWTQAGGDAVDVSWLIANNAMGQQSASESLLLDGETHVVTLRGQRQLGRRLSLGVTLPWIAHSGGFLDRAIDRWHDALGLSEGIRPQLPTEDLRYVYVRGGATRVAVDDATSGLGDLRTSLAWRLVEAGRDRPAVDVTADIEWPTGDAGRLTGNGGTDVAAGLRLARPVPAGARGLDRVGWSAQAGVAWPGDADDPLPPTAGQVAYYDAALNWAATPAIDLLVQVSGHGGAWQSDLKMLGSPALQLGFGAAWRARSGYGLRLGFFEDIRTDTTPDFAVELALSYAPGRRSGAARRTLHAE